MRITRRKSIISIKQRKPADNKKRNHCDYGTNLEISFILLYQIPHLSYYKTNHIMNKLLIGFTTGLILGVLYAPAKGAKTRAKLARTGGTIKEGWDTLADVFSASIESIKGEKVYYDESDFTSSKSDMVL